MKKIKNILSTIISIILIIILISIYKKYDYNFYSKGVTEFGLTKFTKDNAQKYNGEISYKIENEGYTSSMFFREIPVNKNSVYKVSCYVKTEEIECAEENSIAGAQILLKNTEEHSQVIKGTNDWTKIELCFNSKNQDSVEVGFSIGGNGKAKGTAWFSNITIEQGYQENNNKWDFICFVFKNINVKLPNNIEINEKVETAELSAINKSYKIFETTLANLSSNKIKANCEIIEIDKPITTMSYDSENGYYIGEKDVYELISPYLEKKEYDHIFISTKLPDQEELGNADVTNWIGLGGMKFNGKGFSNIRILNDGVNYEYSAYSDFPQEVFLHEFLHTLERNAQEYGYTIPELHDNEKYGYKDDRKIRLKKWYIDYMTKNIKDENTNYIGLPEEIFSYKPAKISDFTYATKLDLLDEPKNIIESIHCMIYQIEKFFDNSEEEKEIQIKIVSD